MGKSLATIEWKDTTPKPHDIRRPDLVRIVDEAVRVAETRHPDHPGLDMVRRARHLARNTETVDACTWRNQNSCGCPMTAIGAVTLKDYLDDEGDKGDTGPAGDFVTAYDELIRNHIDPGRSPSYLLTVVD